MRSTSSFRSAALAAGVLLFAAFPGRAQTYKCVYNDCGAACDCTTPNGCSCATGGGGGGGYESRPLTEEEIARRRAFWGDGSSYHVRRDDLPSLFDLLRGKRDSSKHQRKSAIRAGALSAMAAHQALGEGNWPLAESNYRLAIAAGAADRSTLKGLGYVLQRKGDVGAAISTLEIAVRSFPRDEEAKSLLVSALDAKAYALFVKGDFVGAEAAWKRALEVDPDDAQAKTNLPRCVDYRSRTAHRLVPGGPAIPDGQWGNPVARPQPAARLALPGALGQAADAEAEGRAAVTASSDEEAKHRASLVFDTPVKGAVIVSLPRVAEPGDVFSSVTPSPAMARLQAEDAAIETKLAAATKREADLLQESFVGKEEAVVRVREERARLASEKEFVRIAGLMQIRAELPDDLRDAVASPAKTDPKPASTPSASGDSGFPLAAADLLRALDEVSRTFERTGRSGKGFQKDNPNVDWRALEENNCQDFFKQVGDELRKLGRPNWSGAFKGKNANAIAAELAIQSKIGNGLWREIKESEAQASANRGATVVGAYIHEPHGHLALVVPYSTLTNADDIKNGSGPYVRDGNEHDLSKVLGHPRVDLSTWGAVRASRAMPLKSTRWYVYVPSEPK